MSLPHAPESFGMLRVSIWFLALEIEMPSNWSKKVEQQSGRPHVPNPPMSFASSRGAIWRSSMRQ